MFFLFINLNKSFYFLNSYNQINIKEILIKIHIMYYKKTIRKSKLYSTNWSGKSLNIRTSIIER